jgi:hypothetical protein
MQGVEYLRAAVKVSSTHDKNAALALSLGHFKGIIPLLDMVTIDAIYNEYNRLGNQ